MKKTGLLDLQILDILGEHASKDKPIGQRRILELLIEDKGNKVDRGTLSDYLKALHSEERIERVGKTGWCRKNMFTDSELRLLIDSAYFSKQIPEGVAERLIDELKNISPINLKNYVKNVNYIGDLHHTRNEQVTDFLERIGEAIERDRKILIIPQWQGHECVHVGKAFIADPYYIVADKCRYYLICHVERVDDKMQLENRRIDRMKDIQILRDARTPIRSLKGYGNGVDLGRYMREHLYMFSGEAIRVRMRMAEFWIGDFIDWYGDEYRVVRSYKDEEDHTILEIQFTVNENAVFYWVLQYGTYATVIEPVALRQRLSRHHRQMLQKYTLLEQELQ